MRGLPLAKLIAAVVVLTVVTSVIMLIPNWNGEQASTAADKIDTLLDVMIVLCSFVFSIVMVMLGYAVWKWRAKPGDESDGEPIHGNTRLEIAWTVIPTVIVLFGGDLLVDRAGRHRGPRRRTGWCVDVTRSSSSGASTTPRRARPRASCTSRSTASSSSACTRST